MSIDEQLTELEEKLKLQDNKITDLKANVKWLYKYGGSGTGSGGGSGSTSTKTPSLVYSSSTGNISAELGSTTSNTRIVTEGSQNLSFFLRYLNTEHAYKVSYSSNDGISWSTIAISDDNTFTIPLNITGNINIRVRLQDITDNSNGPAALALSFITTPITITTYLVGENVGGSQTIAGEIFMQNYTKIWAVMDIVPHIAGSFTATSDALPEIFSLDEMEVDKTYTSKQLLYDTDFLSDTSNVGAYSLKYSTEFTSDLSGIQTNELEEAFTLIPNSTYAVVTAEGGTIYTSKPDSNYYEFSAGAITFTGKIYKGAADGETFSTVTAEVYNTQGDNLYTFPVSTPVAERSNFLTGTIGTFYFSNERIEQNSSNWFEIRITIAQNLNDTPQVQSYYLFVKKNDNVLKWYPGTIQGEWYFNKENKSSDMFPQSTSEISCYLDVTPVSYSWSNNLSLIAPESQTAIAFKLEEGNEGVQLATLSTNVDNTTINIYQNKIELGSNKATVDIYLPMDNTYHLLQIYGRIVKASGNDLYYEWVAYIDGVIEGALSSFTTYSFSVDGITLNPKKKGVFSINHFNYTVFECNVCKRWDDKYPGMNDSDVTEYYYKYLCVTNAYDETAYAIAIKDFNAIKYTYDSSTHRQEQFTKLSASEVSTLQNSGGLPVLIFQVNQDTLGKILSQMKNTCGEEEATDTLNLENIQYYETGSTQAKNCISELTSTYHYTIKIQGSSTKGFKFKNWELAIVGDEDNETIPIFSLDYGEEGGFFPEQSFTLKADVVDSSHCVNTAVGDFVNDNCTPFNTGYQNCLSGKPLLVLVEHSSDEAATSEYYLLGIYNYNLGRNSKYNLNYAERPTLPSGASGFIVATTPSTQTKATYASAEIANNSCFWDFSQYDSSILFENQYKMDDGSDPTAEFLDAHGDTYYMWGDLVYNKGVFPINDQLQKCVKGVSRAGGCLFEWLGKTFSKNAYFTELNESSSSKAWKEINAVPDSKHKYTRKIEYNKTSLSYYYTFTAAKDVEAEYTQQDLIDCIYGRTDEEGNVTQQPYINYNSVMEYYVIMQAFGLVDSPMKNLNLKTWNYSADKGSTFYAAFYDMDTGFGGDNSGALTITPFAFSDYWETDETGLVTRHLDYWPESAEEIGFDVPSSFLFAIGKYAEYYRQAVLKEEKYTKLLSPMEFWAKLRQPEGSLRNADYFVNNYLNKKFTNTHPMIWNMNYRSKYLIQGEDTNAYDTTQFSKFHGRRLNRTKAWLNNRLHMLDAYFNVNNLDYASENNSKVSFKLDNLDTAVSNLQSNSDVIILQNIFADVGSDGIKTNSNISCTIKALDYSPFIASSTNTTGAMRLFNSGSDYTVSIAVTGNQSIFPYGCSRWTYMDSVNSFIQDGKVFYMKNDYMTNLLCDKPYTTAFSPDSWQLYTPKMQEIKITGSSFKGDLQIYPGTALTYLDLSNTAITFKTQGADGDYNVCPNLKTLKLNKFKGSVTLNNCNMLENIEMNEATLDSLEINPYQGDCSFTNTNITSINIVSTSENATFSLTNDESVQHITLSGFKTVKISGCNALQDINLETLPTTLCVDSCYGGGISFPGQTTNKIVNFSGIETLSLNTTKFNESAITTIKADSNLTNIDARCTNGSGYTSNITFDLTLCNSDLKANFFNSYAKAAKFNTIYIDESNTRFRSSSLESITGTLIINHNNGYSFQNCTKLTTLGKVIFAEGITNADRTFQYCHSLNNISSLTINTPLTNIERMCEWIAYTSSTIFANALKDSVGSVTNMHGCFQGSSITDYSAFLALDWAAVTSKDSILGACNSNVSALSTTITKDYLTFTKASTVDPLCIFQPTTTGSSSFKVTTTIPFNIDSLGETKAESLDFSYIIVKGVNSTNFLTNASECKKVSNLEFVKNTSLTFGDNGHITSFYKCIQTNTVTTNNINSSSFFKKFTSITSSLNALSVSGGLDIANFADYSNLKTSTQLFSDDFNITKFITQTNFVNLVNTIFDSSGNNNLTTVQGVFKNCTITCDASCMETNTLEVSIPSNNKVTNISNLFYNCHAFYTDEESKTHRIYLKFMSGNNEGFSNLTNLHICTSAWEDCYLNKLTETWFANTEKALTNCSYAFKFTQFNQRYSDDISDKTAYVVEDAIYIGNQTNKEGSGRTATTLNSTIAKEFYDTKNGHYIIPSKFFYYENGENKVNKVSAQFNGTEMFMGSSLYGMLPENLFATNSKPSSNCSSMFKFCTLIPYYVASKYQTLLPSTWSYSLGSDASKKILQYTTFKVDIYCIVPNGTEGNPYLTGTMGDTLAGAIIVPTIHQDGDTPVSWSELWGQLTEDSQNYINPTFTSEPSSEDTITIGTIDFIYQYNQYSLDQTSTDFKDLLPISLGMSEEYINTYDSLDFRKHYPNTAWDILPDYSGYSMYAYLLQWAYNYQPATYTPVNDTASIECSDELYKIHIGTQYNGGDTLLFVDDTNTDGFTTSATKSLTVTGLINDKIALLAYGPIFNKDVKIFANIFDDDMCSKLMSFQFGKNYSQLADQYGNTTDSSESGKRFYHKASTPTKLYAYDLSRNLILPAASKTTAIKNIIKGEAWSTSDASKTSYVCCRYYNSRESDNFSNYVERYQ